MTLIDPRHDASLRPQPRAGFDPGLDRAAAAAQRDASNTPTQAVPITAPDALFVSVSTDAPFAANPAGRVTTEEIPVVAGAGGAVDSWEYDSDAGPDPYSAADRDSLTGQLVASIVLPGAAMWRRRSGSAFLLLGVGVVLPVLLLAWVASQRSQVVGLALDPTFLLAVMAIGVVAVLARFAAIGEVAVVHRHAAGVVGRTATALVVTFALSTPVLYVVSETSAARSAVADVFNNDSGDPLFVPDGSSITASGAVVDPAAITNILIIGGDAGPGRWGMRTDTMMLVTLHEASGRMALTSIPRNLTSLQFPPGTPLAVEFPNGFDDLTNALFTHVNTNPALVNHYSSAGMQAEAMALVEALGYSLNVQIDDFALVNMQGFTEVIDAVGGVALELGQRVPLPPSLPGERPLPTEIGPGLVQMDGAMAIAYARSRSADSDYQRMGRQRQLLAALGSQISPTAAAGAFTTVTGVLEDSMRTSLSGGEFDRLLDRLGDNSAISESVGLAPPLITPGSPDYSQIQMIVAGVQQSLVDGVPSGYAG